MTDEERRFLLTRPMRGVTKNLEDRIVHNEISTHTPHAGRDVIAYNLKSQNKISTHTPHAGRDGCHAPACDRGAISTHTPHAGRDGNPHPQA